MLNGKACKERKGFFVMAYLSKPSGAVQGRTETKGIRAEKKKTLACPGA